jgi:hypothetical protein
MHHQEPKSPVSFEVHVARLPKSGLPVTIEADSAQRDALAGEHGLLSVESFRAELLVTSWKRNGVKVAGTVIGDIAQACIVTLEPLVAHIEEPVEGLFLPQDSKLGRQGFDGGGEILIDVEGPDAPETFEGETIDVGALAEQFFALGIDPYPRKQGAALPGGEDDAAVENEFQQKLKSLFGKS